MDVDGAPISPLMTKISMYVGKSKDWWTYLGIKSNPGLIALIEDCPRGAVFFDEVERIPPSALGSDDFFYVFWDGLTGDALMRAAASFLGPGKRLTALVVGDYAAVADAEYRVRGLYSEGAMRFDTKRLHFDASTAKAMLKAKAKAWLMPLKNVAQSGVKTGAMMDLLVGRRRVVFCGSYGTIPQVLVELCELHGTDPGIFDGYQYYGRDADQSLASFRKYLDRNGRFLARLYGRGAIDAAFFVSTLHLLGREYFVERIRAEGIAIYANGYGTGINVNVYTTPFYRQHVFVDFGSVAGAGNYPRLADLVYFGKTTVRVSLEDKVDDLFGYARRSLLNEWFDGLWELYAPGLMEAVHSGSLGEMEPINKKRVSSFG